MTSNDTPFLKERISQLSHQDMLKQCKMMLHEITEGTLATGSTGDPEGTRNCCKLVNAAAQLFEILSDEQKKNQIKRFEAILNRRKRTRTTDDNDRTGMQEIKMPTPVIINHLLPYLDHDTWKSVSILSKEIYKTVHRLKMFPPWPTNKIIRLEIGSYLDFDYTDGNGLLVTYEIPDSVSFYDSRRGFITHIDFNMIKKQEEADHVWIPRFLDRKTLIVRLDLKKENEYVVYVYRVVEEYPYYRKIVGHDMISYPLEKHGRITSGPWVFKRNGTIYVATAHGPITPDQKHKGISGKIVINEYLGMDSWPNCLRETHCLQYPLQYPEIDFYVCDIDIQYVCLSLNNSPQGNTKDEQIVLFVKELEYEDVYYWRVDFDHFNSCKSGSRKTLKRQVKGTTEPRKKEYESTDNNANNHIIPCSFYGRIHSPDTYCGDLLPTLKMVGMPNESNTKYLFRIIGFWPQWWDNEYQEHLLSIGSIDEDEFKEALKGSNKPNIYVWDYNIQTNKFENTNKLLFTNRDGSIMQYTDLTASEDGKQLFSYSKTAGFGVCRIDNLEGSRVQNYKSMKSEDYRGTKYDRICLSSDNRIAFPYNDMNIESGLDPVHINYF